MSGKVIEIKDVLVKTTGDNGEIGAKEPNKPAAIKMYVSDITEIKNHDGFTEVIFVPAPLKNLPGSSPINPVKSIVTKMTEAEIKELMQSGE